MGEVRAKKPSKVLAHAIWQLLGQRDLIPTHQTPNFADSDTFSRLERGTRV